ncbi:hypothetical protein BKA83DRAFT_4179852, partial [Pisolithus microcarpus]
MDTSGTWTRIRSAKWFLRRETDFGSNVLVMSSRWSVLILVTDSPSLDTSRHVQHSPDRLHIRIANEVTTEMQLRSVVDATSGPSVGRYAFMVELQGNLGEFLVSLYISNVLYAEAKAATAPSSLHASLYNLNENHLRDSLSGKIDVPAVRVLRP